MYKKSLLDKIAQTGFFLVGVVLCLGLIVALVSYIMSILGVIK